jgi:peptidoglycan/LPS O-acetylase OafA/YrhL
LSQRYKELDSLRGLASISVLVHHCLLVSPIFLAAYYHEDIKSEFVRLISYTPFHIFWAGHEAVILFFVLSGYVLSLSFLNKNPPEYREYIIKRICRIYVPYIVVILISIVLFLTFSKYNYLDGGSIETSNWFNRMWADSLNIKLIISYIFMLGYGNHNIDTVTWSLVHEIRISLFFPLIMVLVKRYDWKKNLIIGLGIIFTIYILLLIGSKLIPNSSISFIIRSFGETFYYSGFFILGSVLAKYNADLQVFANKMGKNIIVLLSITFLLLYSFEWIVPNIGNYRLSGTNYTRLLSKVIIDWAVAIGVCILFVLSINITKFKQILNSSLLIYVGKISYSVYLIHPIVLLCVIHLGNDIIPLYILIGVSFILSIVIGGFLYRFLEYPSIRLGYYIVNSGKSSEIKKAA